MSWKKFGLISFAAGALTGAYAGVKHVIDNKIYNKDGFNKKGYNREGYDKNGYNKDGFDRFGFNVRGKDTARMSMEDRKLFIEESNSSFEIAKELVDRGAYRPALNSFRTIIEGLCINHLKHYDYLSYSSIDDEEISMETLLDDCEKTGIWTQDEMGKIYEAKKYGNIGSHFRPVPEYNKIHFTMCTAKEEITKWNEQYPCV